MTCVAIATSECVNRLMQRKTARAWIVSGDNWSKIRVIVFTADTKVVRVNVFETRPGYKGFDLLALYGGEEVRRYLAYLITDDDSRYSGGIGKHIYNNSSQELVVFI